MRRIIISIFCLSLTLILFTQPVFAQEVTKFPIKDSAITVVGSGEGIPTPPGSDTGSVPECGPNDDNINLRLKEDFAIKITEGPPPGWVLGGTYSGENANCITKKGLWKTYAKASLSNSFKKSFVHKENPVTIQFFFSSDDKRTAVTSGGNRIQTRNANASYNAAPYDSPSFYSPATWLTHEGGHILQQRDRTLENNFPLVWLATISKDAKGGKCYEYRPYQYGWVIKTYSQDASGGSGVRESMAEAIALYIYNHKETSYGDIGNFKNDCSSTYDWVKKNIFNNYEFR